MFLFLLIVHFLHPNSSRYLLLACSLCMSDLGTLAIQFCKVCRILTATSCPRSAYLATLEWPFRTFGSISFPSCSPIFYATLTPYSSSNRFHSSCYTWAIICSFHCSILDHSNSPSVSLLQCSSPRQHQCYCKALFSFRFVSCLLDFIRNVRIRPSHSAYFLALHLHFRCLPPGSIASSWSRFSRRLIFCLRPLLPCCLPSGPYRVWPTITVPFFPSL